MKRPHAVVFDVFGTLLTHPQGRPGPYGLLAELAPGGRREARRHLMTRDAPWQTLADELDIPRSSLPHDLDDAMAADLQSIALQPGAGALLTRLRECGVKLALASNLATPYIEPVERLLAPWIETRIYSCRIGAIKPDARIFEAAIEPLDITPEQTLFIGDSPGNDIEGARRFGMRALQVVPGGIGDLQLRDLGLT